MFDVFWAEVLPVFLIFGMLALASRDLGTAGAALGLPFISGLIFAGLLVGPYLLGVLNHHQVEYLRFIDLVALPFIAFTAGSEIHIEEVGRRIKSIVLIICSIVIVVLGVGTAALYLLSSEIPFLAEQPAREVFAIAILGGCILVAKSPSSLVAIIKELRGQGPFIQTALGATVVMDAVVIVLFAVGISFADVQLAGSAFSVADILLILVEVVISIGCGVLVGFLLSGILAGTISTNLKTVLILSVGYAIAFASAKLHHYQVPGLPIHLLSEPLLVCMVGGFIVSNRTAYRAELHAILDKAANPVFILFFTALGATLNLNVLKATWHIACILVVVRFIGMVTGCFTGGVLAGIPSSHRRLLGFAFITQAGISLSLAKGVAISYPGWGDQFTTLLVAVIVINTLLGPIFTKYAIQKVGEAHPRGSRWTSKSRKVIIIGVENHSQALARTLKDHGWKVVLADVSPQKLRQVGSDDVGFEHLDGVSRETLESIGADKVDTIVTMLDNETNYKICELAYEYFGTEHLIARIPDGNDTARFYQLGVLVVEPGSAMLNLLDHCIRSPSAASLLLGQEEEHDVIEIDVGNPELHGVAVRNLHLPSDVIILSVRRNGKLIFTHGYTRLRVGDELTIVGDKKSLEEVANRFEEFEEELIA